MAEEWKFNGPPPSNRGGFRQALDASPGEWAQWDKGSASKAASAAQYYRKQGYEAVSRDGVLRQEAG